jgi:uncharacterized membrane-anchored protein
MTAARKILLMLAIVAAAQTSVLAGMVIDRVRLLKTGREIVLPIVPVDPRDLFRGEYVRLGYDISTVPTRLLEGPAPGQNDPFYVVLEKNAAGAWLPIKIVRDMPREASPDRIVLKARTLHGWRIDPAHETSVQLRYGIEGYFVQEGRGRQLEDLSRQQKLAALVAVDAGGNAAIKGLLVDGKLQYEEPLF